MGRGSAGHISWVSRHREIGRGYKAPAASAAALRKNTGALATATALGAAARTLTVPLTFAVLGQQGYGVWLALLAFMAYFQMSDLGTTSAVINPLARAYSGGKWETASNLLSATLIFLTVSGLTIASILIVAVRLFPVAPLLGVHATEHTHTFQLALDISIVLTIGLYNLQITTVFATAFQRAYLASIVETVARVLSLVGIFCLWAFQIRGLVAFSLTVLLPSVVLRVLLLAYLVRLFPDVRIRFRMRFLTSLRGLIGASSWFFWGGCGELLYTQSPYLVLAQLAGARSVPSFAVPYQLFVFLLTLVSSRINSAWPILTESVAADPGGIWALTFLRKSRKKHLLASAFIFVFAGLLLSPACQVLSGGLVKPSLLLGIVFTLHFIQWFYNTINVTFITALDGYRARAMSTVVMGLLSVPATIIGARLGGVTGLATGLLLSMLFSQTWLLELAMRRHRASFATIPPDGGENGDHGRNSYVPSTAGAGACSTKHS